MGKISIGTLFKFSIGWSGASLLGWIGGLIAYSFVRGGLDPLAGNWWATTVAGLIAGLPLGVLQGLLVRGPVSLPAWVLATSLGVLPGLYVFDLGYAVLGYEPPALTYGVAFGLGLGGFQALALRAYARAAWWLLGTLGGYLLGVGGLALVAWRSIPEGADGTGLIPFWLVGIPLFIGVLPGLIQGLTWAVLTHGARRGQEIVSIAE